MQSDRQIIVLGRFGNPVLWNHARASVRSLHQHVSNTGSSARCGHDAQARMWRHFVRDHSLLPTQQFRSLSSYHHDRPQKGFLHLISLYTRTHLTKLTWFKHSYSLNYSKKIYILTHWEMSRPFQLKIGSEERTKVQLWYRWKLPVSRRPARILRFVPKSSSY